MYRLAVLIDDGRPRRGVDGNGFVDGGLGMDGQVEDGGAAVRGFGVETAAKCGQKGFLLLSDLEILYKLDSCASWSSDGGEFLT